MSALTPEQYVHYLSDGSTIFYTLKRRRGMKHLYLYVTDHQVEVRCNPRVSFESIEAFLRQKESWILDKLQEKRKEHSPTEGFPWNGCKIPLHFEEKDTGTFRFRYDEESDLALLEGPYFPEDDELQSLYEGYYRLHAPRILAPRVEEFSRLTGLSPTRIGYRKNRSRWGSCSARNAINLNTRLLTCPGELQDYVILHELCHIPHKNHSRAFWKLVERYMPDWKERRKRLREYEDFLD